MSEEEFKDTVMPLGAKMYGCAASILGDREDALDAVQDALTTLWDKRNLLNRAESKEAYCIATVRNSSLKIIRKKGADNLTIQLNEDLAITSRDNPDAVEDLKIVKLGISSLGENQRKILLLRSMSGLTHEEISKTMGISLQNVRTILSRARKSLLKFIEEYETKH